MRVMGSLPLVSTIYHLEFNFNQYMTGNEIFGPPKTRKTCFMTKVYGLILCKNN
jgi:hypothetical protein